MGTTPFTQLETEITSELAVRPLSEVHPDTRAAWSWLLIRAIQDNAISKGKKNYPRAVAAARLLITISDRSPPPRHSGPSGYSPAGVCASVQSLLVVAYRACDDATCDALAAGLRAMKAAIQREITYSGASSYAEDRAYAEELKDALKFCSIPRRPKE